MSLQVLQFARVLIESGQNDFICMALSRAGCVLGQPNQAKALREAVSAGVGGHASILEEWVEAHGGPDRPALSNHPTWGTQMRLAWLDKMIAEHETNA